MSVRKRHWTTKGGEAKSAWAVNYTDTSGKRRLKTFPLKKHADAFAASTHIGVREGTHTPDSVSVTIARAAELWIAHCEAEGLERGTIKQRNEHLRLHIQPFIGEVKLSALTAPRVQQWLDELRDAGRSLSMRQKVLTNLKTIISYAQSRGMVAQNVARGIRLRQSKRDAGRELRPGVEMPTKAELRTMIDKAPARWRPFIVTATFSGMRASELRGLRWEDVDLAEGVIQIRQRVDAWGTAGAPKSKAGHRAIPLAPMVVNALKEWQLACPRPLTGERDADGKLLREAAKPEQLVFPNKVGKPESHANIVNRFYAPLQIENGITAPAVDDGGKPVVDEDGKPVMRAKYGLHALRHAAVSLFVEQGWNAKKVQTVIGHASIQMTFDLYAGLFADDEGDKQAMARVEAALLAG